MPIFLSKWPGCHLDILILSSARSIKKYYTYYFKKKRNKPTLNAHCTLRCMPSRPTTAPLRSIQFEATSSAAGMMYAFPGMSGRSCFSLIQKTKYVFFLDAPPSYLAGSAQTYRFSDCQIIIGSPVIQS